MPPLPRVRSSLAILLLLAPTLAAVLASSSTKASNDPAEETTTTTTTLPVSSATSSGDDDNDEEDDEPHPDPNDEHHPNMIYVGRIDDGSGRRLGFDVDNGLKYIFGTGFDDTHRNIEEEDLRHEHYGPDAHHDVADRDRGTARERVLHERRHGTVDPKRGPKPFGYIEEHPLDGGEVPPKVVHVEPFFLDEAPVTNKEFGKFVRATYYETEAEHFGWSFVLSSFLPKAEMLEAADVDPGAEDWVAVDGAYWRNPEGPGTSYKYREHHPVVHVSHRDAAEYCKWVGKRLPGEREWEAAARAGHYGPKNRTLYSWGDDQTIDVAKSHANLWGSGAFPWENHAEDGWRGTSPVRTFPSNGLGFYDLTGNVWEWMRGGKHKARIVRGGSYVDSLDGSFNHAATLGARATMHGTTSTGNVGFRCARAPKRRVEHHYVYNGEGEESTVGLSIEDQQGVRRDVIPPQRGGQSSNDEEDDDEFDITMSDEDWDPTQGRPDDTRVKRKVVKPRTRISNEL